MKIVLQKDSNECGPCALAMIYNILNKKTIDQYDVMTSTFFVHGKGWNLDELERAGQKIGIHLNSYKADYESFFEKISLNEWYIVVINKKNELHYVLLKKLKSGNLNIIDSDNGFKKVKKDFLKHIFSGYFLSIEKTEKKYISEFVFSKLAILRMHFWKYFLFFVLSIIVVALNIIGSYYFQQAFKTSSFSDREKLLFFVALFFLLVSFQKLFLDLIKNKILIKMHLSLGEYFDKAFYKLFFIPKKDVFSKISKSEIITQIESLNSIKIFFGKALPNLVLNICFLCGSITIFFFINDFVAWISLLYIMISLMLNIFFILKEKDSQKKEIKHSLQVNDNLLTIINQSPVINYQGWSKYYFRKIEINLAISAKLGFSKSNQKTINRFVLDGLFIFLNITVIYYLTNSYGDFNNLIGKIFVIMQIINLLNLNVIDLSRNMFLLFNFIAHFKKYFFFHQKFEVCSEKGVILDNKISKIEFKELSYKYTDNNFALKNINCQIKNNTLIQGANGAGKSTFGKIISRRLWNYQGKLIINNLDASSLNWDYLQDRICYLSGDFNLIKGTVSELIGNFHFTYLEVVKKLKKLNLIDIFNVLNFNLSFFVSDDGKNLSSGQKQIVNFLSLFFKPKVELFYLDEVLSSVATEIKYDLLNIFKQTYSDLIIVVVDHDSKINQIFKNRIVLDSNEK